MEHPPQILIHPYPDHILITIDGVQYRKPMKPEQMLWLSELLLKAVLETYREDDNGKTLSPHV
jgi:hypothetical protein|tara:strand:- start:513 stop:701 length:189 start_codon:yes stop_codon:yes gene_type:complete